jgi:hypothetical protein
VAALAALALKLDLAATTRGQGDVSTFAAFARATSRFGPVGIYGHRIIEHGQPFAVYNHPPAIGWMLLFFNWLVGHGYSFRFLIRLPASLADVATALLVFELVRAGRSLVQATVAGVLVALSPVLVVVSGFHGNTDPVFVMFALLSLYLLVIKRWGFLAGLSFALAISVKIIPIVALPVLLLVAVRDGRRRLVQFLAGSGVVLAILWLPVVVERWRPFARDVLGYKGFEGKWGLVEFATVLGASRHALDLLEGPGRLPLLLLSCGLPLYVAWRRPASVIPAFGLSLVLVLLLSTGSSGGRYFAWAVAAAFLVDVPLAAAFDIAGGILIVMVYDRWNGGFPWNFALSSPWTHREALFGAFVWFLLLAVAIRGVLELRRPPAPDGPGAAPAVVDATDGGEADVRLATSDLN